MTSLLFADTEQPRGLMPFLSDNWLLLLPPVLGFGAIYALLPKARRSTPLWGGILAALALVLGAAIFIRTDAPWIESLLFYAFAGLAIVAGGMMITQKNPVHAALSFAMVVLSTCGLFLLQAAPFLMAATIIIYAGAIVVTFLFVIMLAQQEGPSSADQRTREPFLATLAGCILLASLLCILDKTYHARDLDSAVCELEKISKAADDAAIKRLLGDPAKDQETPSLVKNLEKLYSEGEVFGLTQDLNRHWVLMKVNPSRNVEPLKDKAAAILVAIKPRQQQQGSLGLLQKTPGKEKGDEKTPGHFEPGKLPAANVAALGKTLFTDYLIPVELAATLLLVATIGAIAIAGRKSEELR